MIKKLVWKLGTAVASVICLPVACLAQVNSGSDGSDGAFNPTSSTNINMASRPSGIYQYSSVNIPYGVQVTFTPNTGNAAVVWLVQSNVVINGAVDVSGQKANSLNGAVAGPGGWGGGSGGSNPHAGQGPGGGLAPGGCGSFATQGAFGSPGPVYGNAFLVPLLGGSGGGGDGCTGGSGGGGAILIAANGSVQINGVLNALGGDANHVSSCSWGSGGSGGGIRLVGLSVTGTGIISARGGWVDSGSVVGGSGRVRIDSFQNAFGGTIQGTVTEGFQPVIMSGSGQGARLSITSLSGVAVSTSPSGVLTIPDAVISAQQGNPIPVGVSCANMVLNTAITVTVKPANGASVSAVGYNNSGTLASSTATVMVNMPRGGGLIYATAATSN